MSLVRKQTKFRDRYEIITRISEGNFGTVYKVEETRTNTIYAMKKVMTNSKNRENTLREIEILHSIQHDNV